MKAKNNLEEVKPNRRDFLVNLSLATAALTLNSAFGFPVETEQGNGKLFYKLGVMDSESLDTNGNYQFSEMDLEKLQSGKMESLSIKLGISYDQKRWKTIETSVTDINFMNQLTEIARKA